MVTYINPTKIINQVTHKLPVEVYQKTGQFIGGCWDKNLSLFENRPAVQAIRQRYTEGADWEDTLYYNLRKSGKYGTIKDVKKFLKAVDRLYKDIKENGYNENPQTWKWNEHNTNHIGIAVTRKGEKVWMHDGQHRLAIAQVLKLKKVPARVIVLWK